MLTNAASMGTLCLGLPDWWPVNSCGGGGGGGRKSERERKGERVSYYIHIGRKNKARKATRRGGRKQKRQ